jgi:hypothetical protein
MPSSTHLNSSSAVVRVCRAVGIFAPLEHGAPNRVNAGLGASMSVVGFVLSEEAPTRFLFSPRYITAEDAGQFPAFAFEEPTGLCSSVFKSSYRGESSEFLICDVPEVAH